MDVRNWIMRFILPVLVLASCATLEATTYYVDPSGDDDNDGLTGCLNE